MKYVLTFLAMCFYITGFVGILFYSMNLNDYLICLIYFTVGTILLINAQFHLSVQEKRNDNE